MGIVHYHSAAKPHAVWETLDGVGHLLGMLPCIFTIFKEKFVNHNPLWPETRDSLVLSVCILFLNQQYLFKDFTAFILPVSSLMLHS